jgi:hypothetical protein
MRHTNQQLDNVSIPWGGKTTVHLDTGAVLSEIVLMTNLNNNQLLQVQVKLGGDVIYDLTGEDLRMLESYKNKAYAIETLPDGVFIIPFDDLTGRTEDGQNLTGLVTGAQDNLTLILKVAAATAQQITDGDAPEIGGFIRQRARKVFDGALEKRMMVPRKYVLDIDASAAGLNNYSTFARGPRIQRMHMKSANISNLIIKHNRLERWNMQTPQSNLMLERFERNVQAGYLHFDAIASGFNLMDSLQTAGNSFEIKPTVTAAGNIPVLFEVLEAA